MRGDLEEVEELVTVCGVRDWAVGFRTGQGFCGGGEEQEGDGYGYGVGDEEGQ